MAASLNFRPTEEDEKVMALIRSQHPLTANTEAAVIRKAFEDYWFNHGPDAKRSKSSRLERLEGKVDAIMEHLGMVSL